MSKQWWEGITLPQKEGSRTRLLLVNYVTYLLLPILKISVLKKHVQNRTRNKCDTEAQLKSSSKY